MMDKIAMYALIAAALGGLGWLFNSQIDARVHAETRATQAELAATIAERERDRMAQSVQDERGRADQLATDLDAARVIEHEAIAVLEDRERFTTLTGAKPGLLEIKAQKATTRVWQTIEDESNARPD